MENSYVFGDYYLRLDQFRAALKYLNVLFAVVLLVGIVWRTGWGPTRHERDHDHHH